MSGPAKFYKPEEFVADAMAGQSPSVPSTTMLYRAAFPRDRFATIATGKCTSLCFRFNDAAYDAKVGDLVLVSRADTEPHDEGFVDRRPFLVLVTFVADTDHAGDDTMRVMSVRRATLGLA